MPLPVPTTIDTFSGDGIGSDYRLVTDQLLVADSSARTIWGADHAHTRSHRAGDGLRGAKRHRT